MRGQIPSIFVYALWYNISVPHEITYKLHFCIQFLHFVLTSYDLRKSDFYIQNLIWL